MISNRSVFKKPHNQNNFFFFKKDTPLPLNTCMYYTALHNVLEIIVILYQLKVINKVFQGHRQDNPVKYMKLVKLSLVSTSF